MGQQQQLQATATSDREVAATRAQCLQALMEVVHPELLQFVSRYLLKDGASSDSDIGEETPTAEEMVHVDERGDVFACLERIRDKWSTHFQSAGCDQRLLDLALELLTCQGDADTFCSEASCKAFESLATLVGASEATAAHIDALSNEFASLSAVCNTVGGGEKNTGSEGGAVKRTDDNEGDNGEWEIIEAHDTGKRDAKPSVIQCKANAGCAVAQRFVAAHELVEQAKAFFSACLTERAFETIRRAVTLWRKLEIDQAFLDELVNKAKVHIKIPQNKNSNIAVDACFAVAIRGVSASPERDSLAFWRECVAAHPSVAIFQYWLALELFDHSSFDAALVFVDKALELESNPQWLYLRARCLSKMSEFTLADRVDAFRVCIAKNPPDEAFVPQAYYALALLYLEEGEYAFAKRYQALAQLAERPPIRLPTFGLVEDDFHAKRMLRVAFRAPLYLLSIKQQLECVETSELECECCQEWMSLLSLLRHKMESCVQRPVGCLLCGVSMKPELLLQHQEQDHSPR
ncbi:hypothetical protein Gpo141_00010177 [Globisporangium polare]